MRNAFGYLKSPTENSDEGVRYGQFPIGVRYASLGRGAHPYPFIPGDEASSEDYRTAGGY